jgi:hypothetical protein
LGKLEDQKRAAIARDDFIQAQRVKVEIEAFKAQERLGELEFQKKDAIAKEDFIEAQRIKEEIEAFKAQAKGPAPAANQGTRKAAAPKAELNGTGPQRPPGFWWPGDLARKAAAPKAELNGTGPQHPPGIWWPGMCQNNLSTNGDFIHMEWELYNNEGDELRALKLHRQRQAAGSGSTGAKIVLDPADHSSLLLKDPTLQIPKRATVSTIVALQAGGNAQQDNRHRSRSPRRKGDGKNQGSPSDRRPRGPPPPCPHWMPNCFTRAPDSYSPNPGADICLDFNKPDKKCRGRKCTRCHDCPRVMPDGSMCGKTHPNYEHD